MLNLSDLKSICGLSRRFFWIIEALWSASPLAQAFWSALVLRCTIAYSPAYYDSISCEVSASINIRKQSPQKTILKNQICSEASGPQCLPITRGCLAERASLQCCQIASWAQSLTGTPVSAFEFLLPASDFCWAIESPLLLPFRPSLASGSMIGLSWQNFSWCRVVPALFFCFVLEVCCLKCLSLNLFVHSIINYSMNII